jgi:hypothetical protein
MRDALTRVCATEADGCGRDKTPSQNDQELNRLTEIVGTKNG